MTSALLSIRGLAKRYRSGGRLVDAVQAVDLDLAAGETLALVGASGSGKTTLARMVMRLIEPSAGTIRFGDLDWLALQGGALRRARQRIQMVFQDPSASFHPRASIEQTLEDPLRLHSGFDALGRRQRLDELLEQVGLHSGYRHRMPQELSGGQRQRVAIARALATNPDLIVLDEPVSALDVSVRAQILNLLRDLQVRQRVAFLLISHDLAVVRAVSDRVAVMANGRIVETGPTAKVIAVPGHAATRALLDAVPRLPRP
jgi:peptide/nickel transport system ATP-binding protein